MKIRITLTTTVAAAALALVAGCSHSTSGLQGNGVIKHEDREVPAFTKVEATGGFAIDWSGGQPAVGISADENLLPVIETVVQGDTLTIRAKGNLRPRKKITVTLSSAALRGVELTGGIRFAAKQVAGPELKLTSTGAASFSIGGAVTHLEADLTGACKLTASSLETQEADLTLVGASEAEVNVTDRLKVSVAGASSLTYSGNPKTVDKDIAGVGTIRHRP